MQSRSARTGALAQEREKEVEEGRKNLRNAPHSAARNTPSAPQVRKSSVVALVLISLVLLQFGLFATWSQLTRQPGNSKSQKCGIIVREYEIESLAQIDQLSPQVRYTWDLLDCNTWLQAAPGRFADASPGLAAGKTRNATDETEAPPYTCPAPCADSWSFGEWVQWCPPYAHKSKSCGYNFVLPNQQCMFHWFDRKETAQCMKNNWIMVLGSSGAMNLGLTWLMALDPEGTKEPFYGPRWYNKTCWHNKSVPCEKNWLKPKDLSFVNFQTMAYDLIMDSNGKVVYKASSKFDDKELPHLSQAPVVPPGGWRLTVQPVQYAHEVVTKVHKAIAPESWKGSMPIVYAQVGQWYLNAFDGRSRQWGLNTSEVAALERLREPRQLFEVYYDDVLWMVESLQQLNVQAIALGTMPVSKHRCRKREGLGCRTGLNSMIDLVLQHQTSIANEQEKSGKMAPVFAVDWASVSVGEQGGAHTDHKGALLGLQRFLSVICPSPSELRTAIMEEHSDSSHTSKSIVLAAEQPCARVGVFSRSCGIDNDWRRMIGRRCNVSTLDMDASQVLEMLNDAKALPAPVALEGVHIVPKLVELTLLYKVQYDPTSERLLDLWQNMLLVFSIVVLVGMARAQDTKSLPVPCCEWLHSAPGETCWAAMHEGMGQVHDSVHSMCSSLPCLPCWGSSMGTDDRVAMKDLSEVRIRVSQIDVCSYIHSLPTDIPLHELPSRRQADANTPPPRAAYDKNVERRKLDAITGARLLASLHVAATHMARLKPPATMPIYFFSWGFTWVPWFFMLSGYILAYARLSQPKSLVDGKMPAKGGSHLSSWVASFAFCHRRLASVYPLYMLGVCISLGLLAEKGKLFTVRPSALLSQVFLMQAWLPSETEHALQSQCWFLSAIIPFWLMHQSIVNVIDRLPNIAIVKLLALISLFPWIVFVLLPGVMGLPHEWYSAHKWKGFTDWIDVAVVALKFHPACYLHIYVFGVALAALYVRLQKGNTGVPWLAKHGAILGYTLLMLVFTLPPLCPPAHKLLCRLGGLAPLQGLVLVGLSEGRDPVAKLLQSKVFATTGAWSFGVYILHFEVLALWGGADSGKGVGLGYWVLLLALAALAHHYVQVPWGTDLRLSLSLRLAAASVLLAAMALSSVPDYFRSSILAPPVTRRNPAALVYQNGAVDFRLTLRVPPEDQELAFIDWMNGGQEHVIINPSLAQDPADPSSVWIAGRLHRKDVEKHSLPPEALGFQSVKTGGSSAAESKAIPGLVSKEVDGDALGQGKNQSSSRKEKSKEAKSALMDSASDAAKKTGAATRKLLSKLLSTSTGGSRGVAAGGAGNGNVSVTILKWNSRVAVGVVDLKRLTVGAEALLHPVFVPMPSNSHATDVKGEEVEEEAHAKSLRKPMQRHTSTRQLTATPVDGDTDTDVNVLYEQAAVERGTARARGTARQILSHSREDRSSRKTSDKTAVKGTSPSESESDQGGEGEGEEGTVSGGEGVQQAWVPCMPPPVRNEANNSATLSFATGPEDPRLQFSETDGAMRISIFSYVPGAESATDIPKPCANRRSYGRMYETTVSAESKGMTTAELFFDDAESTPIEKNWMRFEHKGVAQYIRSLHPFVVLAATKDGLKVVMRTEVWPFRLAADQKLAIHGGSNPVLIRKNSPSSLEAYLGGIEAYASYYLGTFHTRDSKGRYRNYAFAFQPAKPFAILGITGQLPLLETGGKQNAFLSGLFVAADTSPKLVGAGDPHARRFRYTQDPTTVFFSYGAGDEESRIFKVPLWQVERWLFPEGHPKARQTQTQPHAGAFGLKKRSATKPTSATSAPPTISATAGAASVAAASASDALPAAEAAGLAAKPSREKHTDDIGNLDGSGKDVSEKPQFAGWEQHVARQKGAGR